jgi:hypothetical protein
MRYRCRSLIICLLAVMAADVQAGWLVESREAVFESRRNTAKQIGVVILRDVHQLSQDEVERVYGTGFLSDRPAYSLRAEFRQTLRGAPPTAPLKIPFTFIGPYEDFPTPKTNQEREADLEGREAVVIVSPGEVPRQPIVFQVLLVKSDETLADWDETVKLWRKLTALWNTADSDQRRSELRAGCRDALPEFQDYCCRRLANWSGGKPDPNAAEQIEPLAALPVIWNVFKDPVTLMGVLATCDEILGRTSPGWRTHPTRHDVLAAALRRQSQSPKLPDPMQTDFNLFLQKLSAVSHFPGKERGAYKLFDEIIQSARQQYPTTLGSCSDSQTGLGSLSYLYRPHSQDADQQRLNQTIWDRLVTALAKPDTAESAANARDNIARDYAYVGLLPTHVSEALAAPRDELPPAMALKVTSNFDHLRQKLPEFSLAAPVAERLRKAGYEHLTVPTRSQLGKKVVFVTSPGRSLLSDPVFGHGSWSSWCGWYDAPVWIEKPADWPKGGPGLMVVTGTLAERHDVPVFRLDADVNAPFQTGLPVPSDQDAEEVKQRYLVVDVTWQLLKK